MTIQMFRLRKDGVLFWYVVDTITGEILSTWEVGGDDKYENESDLIVAK
ncbi:hypothetical protein [Alicyclobacillus dauci]|uniref:PepSY domain-containing protein n=1 Tax=Alicyclobacillus dauci TaxID=1475485 RepID=A0ABY6Z9F9_9BACL|nr:hypothetical protein [Alicyclobacillus dauci]WAH39525.1 hypothetical protein NZD86_24470 [Alicyclobacillus dauci]WAH39585.1 hypothetical protein NZD86_24170 [Alicyclobacillus dauci]